MDWTERQIPIDISGTTFPKIDNGHGCSSERFWYVKDEFIHHSKRLLNEGKMFSHIGGELVGNKWICTTKPITLNEIASYVWSLRLFYMKSECMSIYSFCTYLENNIDNIYAKKFYRHMRDSWEDHLELDAHLFSKDYQGPVITNKNLIDTLLYSGNFHSQEKYKKRFDELLEYMDESLIYMSTYNALHNGYQMNQISRSLMNLREDNLVILLPAHLQHEWDDNCPYKVIKREKHRRIT